MKKLCALICLISVGAFSQEVSKDIAKLDAGVSSGTLDELGKTHANQLSAEHVAKLAFLEKSGVVVIRQDTLLTVEKLTRIVFNWPVSYGQKVKDRSEIAREPQVVSLLPGKDTNNKDIAQKWRVNYKDGSIKAE